MFIMIFQKEMLTLTTFNVLIGFTIWILHRLIGQLNSHMIKSFAYFTNTQCCYVTVTMDHGSPSTIFEIAMKSWLPDLLSLNGSPTISV